MRYVIVLSKFTDLPKITHASVYIFLCECERTVIRMIMCNNKKDSDVSYVNFTLTVVSAS